MGVENVYYRALAWSLLRDSVANVVNCASDASVCELSILLNEVKCVVTMEVNSTHIPNAWFSMEASSMILAYSAGLRSLKK